MKTARIAFVSIMLFRSAVGSTHGGEVQLNGYTFRIPDGFSMEVVAKPPLVSYPICADFDEQGRLYIAEASGAKDWNNPQPDETKHRILRLEDNDGDGRFDRRTVFATFDMLAQGSMWLDGSLYTAAPPVIGKLTDTDGDGVAEQREKWVETKEVTACLNDLRGPYLGPDGWIYWCKGPAKQTYQVNGKLWTTTARHIIRRHPDLEDVEQVMVGGMDNSIEVAFSRGGERFVTTTNIHYLGQPRKDGVLHAVFCLRSFWWREAFIRHPALRNAFVARTGRPAHGLPTDQGAAVRPSDARNGTSLARTGHIGRHIPVDNRSEQGKCNAGI